MRHIAAIAIAAAGLLTTGSAMAQDHVASVNVPFSFNVDGKLLPAGSYLIGASNSTVLTLRSRQNGVNEWALVMPGADGAKRDDVLVFHRYGDQYFLREIHDNAVMMNVYLPVSSQEKRAQTQNQAMIARPDDVMVAMK